MRKGRESASFEYDLSWLQNRERFALEPMLSLIQTTFHTAADQVMFGVFGDTAPDRWGRVLMRRAQRQIALEKNETPHSMNELDYLLSVNDEARQGALRFSQKQGGPFLNIAIKKLKPRTGYF